MVFRLTVVGTKLKLLLNASHFNALELKRLHLIEPLSIKLKNNEFASNNKSKPNYVNSRKSTLKRLFKLDPLALNWSKMKRERRLVWLSLGLRRRWPCFNWLRRRLRVN